MLLVGAAAALLLVVWGGLCPRGVRGGARPLPCNSVSLVPPSPAATEYIHVAPEYQQPGSGCTFILESSGERGLELRLLSFQSDGRSAGPCGRGGLALYNHRPAGGISLAKRFCTSLERQESMMMESNVAVLVSNMRNGSFSVLARSPGADGGGENEVVGPPPGAAWGQHFRPNEELTASGFVPMQSSRTEAAPPGYRESNDSELQYMNCFYRMLGAKASLVCPPLARPVPAFTPGYPSYTGYVQESWPTPYYPQPTTPYYQGDYQAQPYAQPYYPYPGSPTRLLDLTTPSSGMTQALMQELNSTDAYLNFSTVIKPVQGTASASASASASSTSDGLLSTQIALGLDKTDSPEPLNTSALPESPPLPEPGVTLLPATNTTA